MRGLRGASFIRSFPVTFVSIFHASGKGDCCNRAAAFVADLAGGAPALQLPCENSCRGAFRFGRKPARRIAEHFAAARRKTLSWVLLGWSRHRHARSERTRPDAGRCGAIPADDRRKNSVGLFF